MTSSSRLLWASRLPRSIHALLESPAADIDLSDDEGVTCRLLARPLEWKVRAVESLEVSTARSCQRRRSLQVAPLRDVLTDEVVARGKAARWSSAKQATVVLPVATLPKGPLVNFDIRAAEGPAYLLPRTQIAERETAYLCQLAREAGLHVDAQLRTVLVAMCGFSSGPWQRFLDSGQNPRLALTEYLQSGIGGAVTGCLVDEWSDAISRSGEILQATLRRVGETANATSAVENPLLVLPELIEPARREDLTPIGSLLARFDAFVQQASECAQSQPGSSNAATDLLLALADYGRRWDVMVSCTVPLDAPFSVKTVESRPLMLSSTLRQKIRQRATGKQEVVVADARTNHVSIRVTDPNVELYDVQATDLAGTGPAWLLSTTEHNAEVLSFYMSNPDRDFSVCLDLGLRPTGLSRSVTWVFTLLVVLALVATLSLASSNASVLAVLVVPTTFAGSLLLLREPSSLGTRLKRTVATLLACALVVLWVAVVTIVLS